MFGLRFPLGARALPAILLSVAALATAVGWGGPFAAAAADETGARLYPGRHYPGVADSSAATPVVVGPGQTFAGADILVDAAGGLLRGSVQTVPPGATEPVPVEGVLVEAIARGRRVRTRTDAGGAFRLTGVPAGTALVRYATDDPLTREGRFAALFHPGVDSEAEAARLLVEEGGELLLDPVVLPPAARVGGSVRAADDGEPLAGVEIQVVELAGGEPSGRIWRHRTREDGGFIQGGLPPGAYTVFADVSGSDYVPEYLGGARSPESAEAVVLQAGEDRLDLVLAPDRGGAINGSIREEGTDDALADYEVVAIEAATGRRHPGRSGEYGGYRIGGLPTGRYRIYAPGLRRWWAGTHDSTLARVEAVTEPEELYGIAITGIPGGGCQLPPYAQGIITGSVGADFLGVERAVVRAWSQTDTVELALEFPGPYVLGCLKPGTYHAAFLVEGPLRARYHWRTNLLEEADPIEVKAQPDTAFGVDFHPERAAAIAGRVLDRASGEPLAGVRVRAVELQRRERAETETDAEGRFLLDRLGGPDSRDLRTGLPAGTWRVTADTSLVADPVVTPTLQPAIQARNAGRGVVTVVWRLPVGHRWRYEVERETAGDRTRIDAGERDATGEDSLRIFDRPPAPGPVRYVLRAWVGPEGAGEPFLAWSDWIEPEAALEPAGVVRALPSPWNGRGAVRLVWRGGPAPGEGRLRIVDASGRIVRTLEAAAAGAGEAFWDGRDGQGRAVPSGLYLLRREPGAPGRPRASGLLLLIR